MNLTTRTLACAFALMSTTAYARVTTIQITSVEPFAPGTTFGEAGAYEKVKGTFKGELDPRDPRNAVIVNLDRAPRNAAGRDPCGRIHERTLVRSRDCAPHPIRVRRAGKTGVLTPAPGA